MITDEGGQSEVLRQILKVEGMLEGGCRELLDKDQALIKQGKYFLLNMCAWLKLCLLSCCHGEQETPQLI